MNARAWEGVWMTPKINRAIELFLKSFANPHEILRAFLACNEVSEISFVYTYARLGLQFSNIFVTA